MCGGAEEWGEGEVGLGGGGWRERKCPTDVGYMPSHAVCSFKSKFITSQRTEV